jgi:hypothetical protein
MSTATRRSSVHGLAMVRRERIFPHECSATNAPLRVNDCQFALGFDTANLRKNRRSKGRSRYACRRCLACVRSANPNRSRTQGQE